METIDSLKTLKSKEKKELFEKITRYLQKRIEYMVSFEKWTKTEIARETKIGNNMLTMYCNYDKYKRCVSESDFISLIVTGVLKTKDMTREIDGLTDKEKKFITDHEIHEDRALRKEYKLAKERGENPADILKEARLKAEER